MTLFIYLFLLCWVFVSVWGLSLVAVSGGHSSSQCTGLSLLWPLLLWSTGSRRAGSVGVVHGFSCSTACGIFPDQGSNPCPLHWQADSQPLCHQGSPWVGLLDSNTHDWRSHALLHMLSIPRWRNHRLQEPILSLTLAVLEEGWWGQSETVHLTSLMCPRIFCSKGALELICWTPWLPQRYSHLSVTAKIEVLWEDESRKLLLCHLDDVTLTYEVQIFLKSGFKVTQTRKWRARIKL